MSLADQPTYVYRLFDAEGRLLYVGMTSNVDKRVAHHRVVQPWGGEIASVDYEVHPDRATARAVEAAAALSSNPLRMVGDGGSGRKRKEPPAELLAELRAIRDANTRLRGLVLEALDAGGSVRVVAEIAGLSTATVQNWSRARRSR